MANVESATAEATVVQTYKDHLDEVARAQDELTSKCRRIAELNDLWERAKREKLEAEAAMAAKQTPSCGWQCRYYADVDRSS